MSSMTDAFEAEILDHIFLNQSIPNIGNAGGLPPSTADGDLFYALFTGDPGEGGSVANECDYTNYTREAVSRTNGFQRAGSVISNAAEEAFPAAGAGPADLATHCAICKGGTPGVADIILHGILDTALNISEGITPRFAPDTLKVTAD